MKKIKEFFKINLKTLKPTNFIFLLFAGAINAFGVTIFLFPVKLYDSGISGLSMLLDQITPIYLTLSIFSLWKLSTSSYPRTAQSSNTNRDCCSSGTPVFDCLIVGHLLTVLPFFFKSESFG